MPAALAEVDPTAVRGDGATIAVVDDAVDTRHPEFAGRIAGEWDAVYNRSSALPHGWQPHGTKVAGLALAGGARFTGMAPEARLLAVRVPTLTAGVGDAAEARAIRWAAEHGADVICCAWGPSRPTHESGRLPVRTREAIDWALTRGRGGRGCVVVFSSGNDGGDVALNGYASHPGVVAVGACSARGKRPAYSSWGKALWCVYQSNDPLDPIGAAETHITTTPIGSYLLGETFYTRSFGFTSASCAAVAGICALIVSANSRLTAHEVKLVLARSCKKIDVEHGAYDASDRSPYYGFGVPEPLRAVEIALRKSQAPSV
jgi:subtilisin family serine protease